MKPVLKRTIERLDTVSELAERTAVAVERLVPDYKGLSTRVAKVESAIEAIRSSLEALGRTIDGLDEKVRAITPASAAIRHGLTGDQVSAGEELAAGEDRVRDELEPDVCPLCRDTGEVETKFLKEPERAPCPKCRPADAAAHTRATLG